MSSAQDPFYIVKEEVQESIDKLQSAFHQWEQTRENNGERVHLTKDLVAACESLEWQIRYSLLHQNFRSVDHTVTPSPRGCNPLDSTPEQLVSDRKVDELDKAIAVAARDPASYGIDETELERRRRWTIMARNQVGTVRKVVEGGKEHSNSVSTSSNGIHKELMRLQIDRSHPAGISNQYDAQDNDDFISSETDRQLLLIKRQDEELDELSASVLRIGGVGLTIHEELIGQERIIDELSSDMDSTANRLDFVQKKVALVMKKAGAKGQIMMIAFLVVLFIILFVLVFFT